MRTFSWTGRRGRIDARVLALTLAAVALGAPPAASAATFSSSDPITITSPPDGPYLQVPATPYPSTISVTGVAAVEDVEVTLTGFSHTYLDDVRLLLVGPQGQTVMLRDHFRSNISLSDATLTFDDAATQSARDALSSGSYRPTGPTSGEALPDPAPAAPYGATLGAFNGTDPTGEWKLYVVDGVDGDDGSIAGWSLDIDGPATNTAPVAADDAYTVSAGATLTVPAADGVLVNDSDADGDALFAGLIDTPRYGILHFAGADGSFSYEPYPGFVGTDGFSYIASDGHLGSALATVTITVQGTLTEFLAPIDDDAVNLVKAGQSVPVKFSLGADYGLEILLGGAPTSRPVACQDSMRTDAVEQAPTSSASGLSYDPATDTYTYVWKTDKSWANSCRELTVTLTDGSSHSALFHFTR